VHVDQRPIGCTRDDLRDPDRGGSRHAPGDPRGDPLAHLNADADAGTDPDADGAAHADGHAGPDLDADAVAHSVTDAGAHTDARARRNTRADPDRPRAVPLGRGDRGQPC
jgi:hypothetical protein